MSPFVGRPEGFSTEALELLDRALQCIWDDVVLAKRRGATVPSSMPPGSRPGSGKWTARTTGRPRVPIQR